MTDRPALQVAGEAVTQTRRVPLWTVAAGVVAGGVLAAVFMRRQVHALIARARPYVRREARIDKPVLIVNRWSGDGKAEKFGLAAAAEKAGIEIIMLERGDDLVQLAHDAVSAGADAVGMAGGDGSLGLVAGVAADRGVSFFCVPVGTRNHFALDLGLDRDDPLAALDAIRDGDEIRIDYCTANGRPFLNNISFGVYAQAVHEDRYRGEKEATLADYVRRAASDIDAQAKLRYATPDGRRHHRAPLLLVSNNRYAFSGFPDYGRRLQLDSGKLGISALTTFRDDLLVHTPLYELHSLHEWTAVSYRIESDEPILAGLDGEAVTFESPLDITIRRRALGVLVPKGTRPGFIPTREVVAAHLLDLAETVGIGD